MNSNSGFFDIGKNIYKYLISNTQFKNSFEKKIKNPEKISRFIKDKNISIFFRTKNIPNHQFFAYNKIGLAVSNEKTENENLNEINSNIIFTGIEINKSYEAKDFLENSIDYWNYINLNKKINLHNIKNNNIYFAPFFYHFLKIKNKTENKESLLGIGIQFVNTEKLNFKINSSYSLAIKDNLDFFAKIKYKRLNIYGLNKESEEALITEVKNLLF